ncbi:MAG: ThiF family adenylyltransferase [Jatrophihabitantaceae bacterium]
MTDPGRYAIIERVSSLSTVDYSMLGSRRVVVVGCGALGSAVAMHLVRSGVGAVRVVDRDVVELRNLAVQVLYTEQDAAFGRPKAEAAQAHLRELNAGCEVDGVVADFAPGNARELVDGADLIIDGVDNLETKLLLNDVALAYQLPLVYAGCAGAEGSVLAIVPGVTHCLRCLWPAPGAAAARLSCQTRGLLPATAASIAGLQCTEAMKLLLGLGPAELSGLVRIDVWNAVLRRVPLPAFELAQRGCPACGAHDFSYLRGEHQTVARELCGDDTVLLCSPAGATDLTRLSERHRRNTSLRALPNCVQLEVDGCRILAFASGRTLIHGAGGLNQAKSVYAQHVLG